MAAGHAGLQLSFGSTGDCFDNAAMEPFWATLKREITHVRGPLGICFETRDAARAYLFEYIEVFYNRQRHQAGPSPRPSTPPRSVHLHKPCPGSGINTNAVAGAPLSRDWLDRRPDGVMRRRGCGRRGQRGRR
jgi:Integrase core domain